MTTRIEKDFRFRSAVHFENKFEVNSYALTLSMLVETESLREQNIALSRITYFLEHVLQDSIFIFTKNKVALRKYIKAGIRTCELPDEPCDKVVSMIILLKLNSILEGRLKITDLMLKSTLGGGTKYNVVMEIAEGLYSGNHWWNKSCTHIKECEETDITDDNIVKLFDDSSWGEFDLTWKVKK